MSDKVKHCVWPDDDHCLYEDVADYNWKSDDYLIYMADEDVILTYDYVAQFKSMYNYRMALRMTQEDLGKAIGKSARTIQRYESGETPTPILVYNAVKKLFDDKVAEGKTDV